MKTLLLLYLVVLVDVMANENVWQDFSYICSPTQKAINMNHECSEYNTITDKLQCVVAFNRLEDLKFKEDEFNYVKLFKKNGNAQLN